MSNFMPHGYCMRWDFWLLVQHVLSDLLIAAAYFTIPAALVTLVRRRKDVSFGFLFWLFSLFIFSCGVTHLFEIYVLWSPQYWLAGWAKVFTAAASVTTAIMLWKVIPAAVHLPSPQQLAAAREETEVESKLRIEAERGSRLKDDFLATLSHELRTPLTAILGWTQLLESGGLGEDKTKEAIKIIERNARSQAQLINDLLDLSAITSGKMRIEFTNVNISEVINSAMRTVLPLAASRRIKISLDEGGGPHFVSGDADRLEQVIWNLLSNSLKFTPEDGRVDITVRTDGARISIRVADNGAGIKKEYLPLIFEKFSQADNTLARSKGGLGIGLALANQLVQLHAGSIRAESAGAGLGSTFTVDLPLSPLAPQASAGVTSRKSPSLAGQYILVVEDEADSRELFVEVFRKAGAEVLGVGSAEEALREVQRRRPDAIVSDLAMPGKDGLWLIRQVRERPDCDSASLPALAVSAMTRDADRKAALDAGFQMHLAKPLTPENLLHVLSQLLRKSGT